MRKIRLQLLAGTTVAIVATVGFACSLHGEDDQAARPPIDRAALVGDAPAKDSPRVVSSALAQNRRAILRHWTPARRANAAFLNADGTAAARRRWRSKVLRARTDRTTIATVGPVLPVPRPYTGLPSRTIGRIFFTTAGGVDASCTGTALESLNMSVVWTAGQCVYWSDEHSGFDQELGTGWVRNVIFIPGYGSTLPASRTTGPHGIWTARKLVTSVEWSHDGNQRFAIGAVVVNKNYGGRLSLVGVTGGLRITFNSRRDHDYRLVGYPYGGTFSGDDQWRCDSPWIGDTLTGGESGPLLMKILCSFDETPKQRSQSGDPWLTGITRAGFGYVTGVSIGYSSTTDGVATPDNAFSPYFGNAARLVYDVAQTS